MKLKFLSEIKNYSVRNRRNMQAKLAIWVNFINADIIKKNPKIIIGPKVFIFELQENKRLFLLCYHLQMRKETVELKYRELKVLPSEIIRQFIAVFWENPDF